MKIVQVTYTATPQFVKQNIGNIKAMINDLRQLNQQGISYNACLNADGKTFIHTAFFETAEDQKLLNDLPSFKYFQEQLKSSGPEVLPKQELLSLVDSSNDF